MDGRPPGTAPGRQGSRRQLCARPLGPRLPESERAREAITAPGPGRVLKPRAHSRDRARGAPGCTRASLSDENRMLVRSSAPKEMEHGKSPALAQRHTDTSGSRTLSTTSAESLARPGCPRVSWWCLTIRRTRFAAFASSRARSATVAGSQVFGAERPKLHLGSRGRRRRRPH